MNPSRTLLTFAAVLTALAALVALNVAVAGEDRPEVYLDEVVVTATKHPERAGDVPFGISVYSPDQIEDGRIDSMQDAARVTPNFGFHSSGSRRTALFYIRGMGSSGPNPPAVGVFLDDVYLSKTGFSDLDFFDVEHIEILRGPQSTLYGRNTQAGAVKLVTREPGPDWEGRISQGLGSYDALETRMNVSGPVVEDRLFIGIGGSHREREGYTWNDLLLEDVDAVRQNAARLTLRYTPSDAWDIRLGLLGHWDRDGGYPMASLDSLEETPYRVEHDAAGSHRRDLNLFTLHAAYNSPSYTLKGVTAFTDWENRDLYDSDFTAADLFLMDDGDKARVFSQEIRLSSPEKADVLKWLVGAYFSTADEEDTNIRHYGADAARIRSVPGLEEHSLQDVDISTLAFFGRISRKLGDRFRVTLGLRYDHERRERDGEVTYLLNGRPLAGRGAGLDDTTTLGEWSPEFSVDYRWTPDLLFYFRVARGWRAGGFNNSLQAPSTRYDPEYSWNYEAGVKSEWFERRLLLNLDAFYIRIRDQQLIQFQPGGAGFFFANAGSAESRGLETEITGRPLDWLECRAGAGYTDAEYLDARDRESGLSYDGNQLPFVPRFNYSLALQARYPLREPLYLFGRVDLRGETETPWDEANSVETDGYALVNTRLALEGLGWTLGAFVRNLFDKTHQTAVYAFPGSPPLAQMGEPRVWGFHFTYYF